MKIFKSKLYVFVKCLILGFLLPIFCSCGFKSNQIESVTEPDNSIQNEYAAESMKYFLLISLDCSESRLIALTEFLQKNGAFVLFIRPQSGMIVKSPAWVIEQVETWNEILVIDKSVSNLDIAKSSDGCSNQLKSLVEQWNYWITSHSNGIDGQRIQVKTTTGLPLVNDIRYPTHPIKAETGPMVGQAGFTLFTPESTGAYDPNTENWTQTMWNNVYNEVSDGLTWWSNHAASHGKSISFELFSYGPTDPVNQTGYEPITHSSDDICLWINDIMGHLGYYNADCYVNVDDYNTYMQSLHNKDSFASVFVVNSANEPSGTFTDGYFGFASFGGPLIVMTYDNDGWGIDNMHNVTSHETGHIFHACDEYSSPGYYECDCNCSGNPWQTENYNCDNGCGYNYDCLMRTGDATTTCTFTRDQIGWSVVTTTTTTTHPTTTTHSSTTTTHTSTTTTHPPTTSTTTTTNSSTTSSTNTTTTTSSSTTSPTSTTTTTGNSTTTTTINDDDLVDDDTGVILDDDTSNDENQDEGENRQNTGKSGCGC